MDETDFRKALGRRLQVARQDAGFTQTDVGAWFSIDKGAVSAWETGKSVPNASQLRRIALEFDVSVDALLMLRVEVTETAHVSDASDDASLLAKVVKPRRTRGGKGRKLA